MNRRILTLCKYLVATSILFATAPAFSGVNDHPAFKFKSNKELANLKPISKSQTPLSRTDQKPSVDELHYEEKHPHQDATLVDTASIDTSKLIPSKVLSLDPNRPDLELPDPQITIAGKTYILSVVESILDPKEKVRYVTAKIIGLDEGRARFIIDDESGEVVGNLVIEDETYRVIPRELNKDQQLVYEVKKEMSEYGDWVKPELISEPARQSVHRLEKKLILADLLKQIDPLIFRNIYKKTGGRMMLIGGKIGSLGVIDRWRIRWLKDSSVIKKFLSEIEVLSQSAVDYEYEITRVFVSRTGDYSVRYRQVINNILLGSSSIIKFSNSGEIAKISNMILHPDLIQIYPSLYSEADVVSKAKEAVLKHISSIDFKLDTREETPVTLSYKLKGNDHNIIPYWEVLLYKQGNDLSAYRVFIEGHSGKVNITETVPDCWPNAPEPKTTL